MNPQETAAALTERGYIVHTLTGLDHTSKGKAPLERNWQKRTETNLASISNDRGIGVLTGHGLLVVDTDIDEAKNGEAALVALYERHGAGIPPEPVAQTGGGGYHRWYRVESQTPRNTASKLGPGIDTRGDGGQVVVPPSPHHSGRRYDWLHGLPPALDQQPPAPAWMLALLTSTGAEAAPLPTGKVAEGRRNDALTSAVGSWLAAQVVMPSRDETESYARDWNREHCDPRLPDPEPKVIARSIHARELQRRASSKDHEFAPPDTEDIAAVYTRVFTDTPGLDSQRWELHDNSPAPPTYHLITDRGRIELTTLSRYPYVRDMFTKLGLRIRPEYKRQLAWEAAAGWLHDCATPVDNTEHDEEAVSDWLVDLINRTPPYGGIPLIETNFQTGDVAVAITEIYTYIDRHRRGFRWNEPDVRRRLRDAGFSHVPGYWLKRGAWIVRDHVLQEQVGDAMADLEQRRRIFEGNRDPGAPQNGAML